MFLPARSRQWVNGGANIPRSSHMPTMAGCKIHLLKMHFLWNIFGFASHVSFRWTNSIKWKQAPTPCCWIVPILLDVLGCHRVVHKNLKIRLGHVVRVTSERDTWSMSDMKQATDDRRNWDHIILSWFCHFAVQNRKLTSRFCCVFQRVNSCTPPLKINLSPENWKLMVGKWDVLLRRVFWMQFMKILKIVQFLVLIFCCVFHIHQFIEDDIIKRSVDE